MAKSDNENNNLNSGDNNQNLSEDISDEEILKLYQEIITSPEIMFDERIAKDQYTSKWAPSDIKLKNVLGDNVSGLNEIKKLNVKNFTYKYDTFQKPQVGVIAQDLKQVFPNSVKEDARTGSLFISKDEMFYAMINAIKTLSAELQTLKNEIKKLK